ncbi:MAG TPA: phospholipase D-like domain-containing protein [Povalibacter sp.]|uniref:phospholipase D-like domain-containing protein n=1 Tax=Povalibacter sp. TaxID=1962978 RepID=UPI002BF8D2F9|nr:phospholipase D-like domain-containing protein [Povalibacter sp.]HMN45875.1 phospholipase D-like domain-containing protein [Povalibacter sp.]
MKAAFLRGGLCFAAFLVAACNSTPQKSATLPASVFHNDFTGRIYDERTWYPPEQVPFDPGAVGESIQVPISDTHAKIIGPAFEDSVNSLALKLWLVAHARYSVDAVYYIFKRDTAGYAFLGALCDAVKRGVDVRLMIDSAGSIHPTHSELDALQTCADEAGFLLDEEGQPTAHKARIQVVIVNPVSNIFGRVNRRSHDKLLVIDGQDPARAVVLTGGRNLSVSYYGINDDGTTDPTAYQDMEILLRPPVDAGTETTVGSVSTYYYTLLWLNPGNRFMKPPKTGAGARGGLAKQRAQMQERLAFVTALPMVAPHLQAMPAFLDSGFREAKVRLAHELGNLTNSGAVSRAGENINENINSIQRVAKLAIEKAPPKGLKLVSPYLFLADYKKSDEKEGTGSYDDAVELKKLLDEYPESVVEIITNSALSSDNFTAQAVIDMDTAPRLLLPPDLAAQWRESLKKGEFNPDLVASERWRAAIMDSRIRIWQIGRSDAAELGGAESYGKLHAKFIMVDGAGFVGTHNFDYRSRVFNNEFGFYFQSDALHRDLNAEFERLKSRSYLWGTPEWLELRRKTMDHGGMKGYTTRHQRGLYKIVKATGLMWFF